jgi:hypothetical protein
MGDRLSIKYFFGTKHVRVSNDSLLMNNDVMMINKEHETFQFTQLNNIIKDSKILINLHIL